LERSDIELRFIPSLVRAISPLKDLLAFWQLYRLCRREKFHLVHTHTSKAGILGRWAAWLSGCRLLVHTPHGHVFTGYYGPFLSRLFVWAERLTAKITRVIITLTPVGIEDHLAWRIAPREKFVAVPSGVEMEGFEEVGSEEVQAAREALGIPPEGLIVGSAGRLDRIKGYDLLVEASALVLKEVPGTWFVVAGEGPERQRLEERARRLGVSSRWRLPGWQKRLEPLYHAFDLFAQPSRNEGMGRAAVEAMACGRAVVASAVGGLPWVVEDGVTGLLVEPEDPEALARALVKLLRDEKTRRRMGEAGLRRAKEHFSCQVMLEGIEKIYQGLLGEGAGP
jgi:glycosyltransferase involved in cell wall biosynthesis